MPSANVEALEAENARLRRLLAEAGIDAQARAIVHAGRDARQIASLTESRAETAEAREDARLARLATGRLSAVLATSEGIVADLQASQALLQSVLNTVPVGILLAEAPGGRIIMGNARVEEILGHPPIYSTDTSTYDAYNGFHADGRQVAADEWPLARVVNGADRAELEAHYQRPDGSLGWIAVNGEAVKADGVTVGAVIAIRSIEDRKRADATQDIINRELSHRLKNTLTLVQSIATQTLRNAPSLAAAREALGARLVALGRAHDVLLAGDADNASVADVARGALALHEDVVGRFHISGPALLIGPSAALTLGLMLHELATNATKYGALSTAAGRVDVTWAVTGQDDEAEFRLTWTESGGPPVTPPARKGFGSRLIERGFSGEAGGAVALDYSPGASYASSPHSWRASRQQSETLKQRPAANGSVDMSEHPSRQRALAVVAEDELVVRLELFDFLTDEGFDVHEAPNAGKAIEHLERLDGVALLFTDIRMPGDRDGLILAREVADRWPDTRIIICSAFPRPPNDAMPAGAFFFDKPFLDAAVRKVLR